MKQLRPYQNKLLNETRQALRNGYKAPCIVAPCGAGKSVIVADIAKSATHKGNRVLFLVHRKELCDQIIETFTSWGVDMNLCHIAMVQTISRRLGKIHTPSLIITDENHHCLASTYRKIYDFFEDIPRIGVTATPVRLNGGGLGEVNDILITGVNTEWLIENNFLAPFDYYAPSLLDSSALSKNRGEFVASQIEELMDKPAIYGDAVQNYKKYVNGEKAICYCASINHSERMAEEFNLAGIAAAHIDGETLKPVRDRVINDFRNGTIKILCNVDLISEGFDVPDCKASILLRPTASLTLFIQQAMRCMRYQPGKRAVIIDHVQNYKRFGMPDMERDWKLDPKRSEKKEMEVPVRVCPNCYAVLPSATRICPSCEEELTQERTIEEIKGVAMEKIEGFVLDYTKPSDCSSVRELEAYARRKGYKPGWVYFQARQRGWIA